MKKSLITLLTATAITGNAQNWLTTLNSGATTIPRLGLSTNHPLSFLTNNLERMTLTNTGRLGIGLTNPTYALDVVGEIRASTNVRVTQKILFGSTGQLQVAYSAPSVASNPGVLTIGNPNVVSVTPDLLCGAINLNAELQNGPSITKFTGLINMATTTNGPALNFAAVTSGATIFSRNSPLYINKCGNDVNMCSDGIGNVGMGALADANTRLYITGSSTGLNVSTTHAADDMYNTKLTIDRNYAKALTVINTANNVSGDENFLVYGNGITRIGSPSNLSPQSVLRVNASSVATGIAVVNSSKTIFTISNSGQTFIDGNVGIGVQPAASAMLNVYDPVGSQSTNLLTIGSLTKPNALNINANGVAIFDTKGTTGSIFKIKNQGSDLFAVRYDGVAYAREVVVTLLAFPDYVFAKNYKLPPLSDVRSFINTNQRLPGMPSASEVQKNGAPLGEIQRVTVEKVEELYLYILQLEEKLQSLQNQINTLTK
jgi:hypothetical protein